MVLDLIFVSIISATDNLVNLVVFVLVVIDPVFSFSYIVECMYVQHRRE